MLDTLHHTVCTYIYIYIYIYYTWLPWLSLGAEDRTPEINTSEIIVDFQLHVPMDVQWQFPTQRHLSAVCSKGMSLSQWIVAGIVQWIVSGILQWNFPFATSGVKYFVLAVARLSSESDIVATVCLWPKAAPRIIRPISVLTLGMSAVLLEHHLDCKGWNSQAHREFPGKFESSNLSRDNNCSREIERKKE